MHQQSPAPARAVRRGRHTLTHPLSHAAALPATPGLHGSYRQPSRAAAAGTRAGRRSAAGRANAPPAPSAALELARSLASSRQPSRGRAPAPCRRCLRSEVQRQVARGAAVHAHVLLQPLQLHQRELALPRDIFRVRQLGVLPELCGVAASRGQPATQGVQASWRWRSSGQRVTRWVAHAPSRQAMMYWGCLTEG